MTTAHPLSFQKKAIFVTLAGLSVAFGALTVRAQEATPEPVAETDTILTAIPSRLGDDGSVTVAPGEKTQVTVRVKNSTAKPTPVRTSVLDFVVGDDGQTPIVVDEEVSNRWSLASWVTVLPQTQTIGANEVGTVTLLIEAPADALPGGHYAMVVHQPDNGFDTSVEQTDAEDSKTAIDPQVGTLLYVTVEGPINEEAYISGLTFPKFTEYGPVPFSFKVENRSDIHVKPRISVEIYNMLGRKVDTLEQEEKNIFPLLSRDYSGEWHQVWGTGYYTAKVVMSYGNQGKIVMDSTTFWLLPIKLILTIIIVLLTLIAAGISVRRHLIHRRDDSGKRVKMLEERLRELENDKLKKYED